MTQPSQARPGWLLNLTNASYDPAKPSQARLAGWLLNLTNASYDPAKPSQA